MAFFTQIFRSVLEWLYSWMRDYGWATIVFTILMRMIMLPLDIKNRKGMIKMQAMQPKIAELQRKYGNDQQKLQQKQMQLFREEHYSPLSGCLPLLLTWPIFIVMLGAMRDISNELLVKQLFTYISGETPVHDSWLWVKNLWIADSPFSAVVPTLESLRVIPEGIWTKVVASLSPEQFSALIANIPNYTEDLLTAAGGLSKEQLPNTISTLVSAAQLQPAYMDATEMLVKNINLFIANLNIFKHPNGYLILPVLAILSQLLMTKFSGMNQQPAQQTKDAKANPQQQQSESMNKFMKYFFPIFTGWICLTSSASFALYWVTSNIVAGISNYAITKYYENKQPATAVSEVK